MGVIVKAKEHRLGLAIFDYICESKEKNDKETCITMEKAAAYRVESRLKMNHVLVKNKPPSDWNIKDLTDIIRVIKIKDGGAMPKKRPALWELYLKIRSRSEDLMIYEGLFQTAPAVVVDIAEQPAPLVAPDVVVDTPDQYTVRQPDPPLAPAVDTDTPEQYIVNQSAPPLTTHITFV